MLFIYAIVLRMVVFIHPYEINADKWFNPLSTLFFNTLNKIHFNNYIVHSVLSILIISSCAFYLNAILGRYKLNSKAVFFPALFFILIGSFINEFCELSPALLALPFLIAACARVFSLYKIDHAGGIMFNAGFLISIAALFYFPYLIFFIFLLIGFIIIRPFNIREYLSGLAGVLVPIFFASVIYYWNHILPEFFHSLFNYYATNSFQLNRETLVPILVRFGALILLFAWASLLITKIYNKAVMHLRHVILLAYVFALAGLFSTLLINNNGLEHFIWICIPFSIIISIEVAELRRKAVAETLHLCLLLLLFYFQYFFKS